MSTTPKLLCQFSQPATYLRNAISYRVICTDKLVLERLCKDSLGGDKWLVDTELVKGVNFRENSFWEDAYKKTAIPLNVNEHGNALSGYMLDTRELEDIPKTSRGIVHNYSERGGNHAPDNDEQDVYYKGHAMSLTFPTMVPVMLAAPASQPWVEEQILLGAVVLLVRNMQVT